MPKIDAIVETCLYVRDLERAVAFYKELFGFEMLQADTRFCALSVADRHVLILFLQGASTAPIPLASGAIPPHDGSGPVHIGFAIPKESLDDWEKVLRERQIPTESKITWPRGGASLYFRDPDGHLVELLTPGVWPIY